MSRKIEIKTRIHIQNARRSSCIISLTSLLVLKKRSRYTSMMFSVFCCAWPLSVTQTIPFQWHPFRVRSINVTGIRLNAKNFVATFHRHKLVFQPNKTFSRVSIKIKNTSKSELFIRVLGVHFSNLNSNQANKIKKAKTNLINRDTFRMHTKKGCFFLLERGLPSNALD